MLWQVCSNTVLSKVHKRAAPAQFPGRLLMINVSIWVIHQLPVFLVSNATSYYSNKRLQKTDLRSILNPNKCSLCTKHFHCAMQPIPQHFCWDCGQQTRSPRENTNRSICSTENQITPPFISTLVFHLLPESYPLFPLLSPDRHTEDLTPSYLHKHV